MKTAEALKKRLPNSGQNAAKSASKRRPQHVKPAPKVHQQAIGGIKPVQKNLGVQWSDVVGLENVKQQINEAVIWPNMRPDIFHGLRAPPKGMLLFGPPGNGKTMIAKAIATECKATFFSLSASSIMSKFVGEAEKTVKAIFEAARAQQPSIIFIDEIDSMLTARGGANENESARRVKTEFMTAMEGATTKAEDRVLVIGATNLPDTLDDAILRRFPKRFLVPLPERQTRLSIVKQTMDKSRRNGVNVAMKPSDYNWVASNTNGYSCSDMAEVCRDAAYGPIRDWGLERDLPEKSKIPGIKLTHFRCTLQNVKPTVKNVGRMSTKYYADWNRKFGSN